MGLAPNHFLEGSINGFQQACDYKFENVIHRELPLTGRNPQIIGLKDIFSMRKGLGIMDRGDCVCFFAYRYAFENTAHLTKEVLFVFNNDENITLFEMHFRVRQGIRKEGEHRRATGIVFPIGDSLMLTTLGSDTGTPRGRVLFLKQEKPVPRLNKYRFGIMNSTNFYNSEPCAAKVLLTRYDEVDKKKWNNELRTDFGKQHSKLISENELQNDLGEKTTHVLKMIDNNLTHIDDEQKDYVMRFSSTEQLSERLASFDD